MQEQLEPVRILNCRIEPEVVVLGVKDDCHPQGTEQIAWGGGQNRAGVDCLPLGSLPTLPQPCEGEGSSIAHADVEGLLVPPLLLPLVEPLRQDQAPAFAKGRSKGGLGRGGLGLGVDPPLVSSLAWGSAGSL